MASVDRLIELVRRYIAGDIQHAEFRNEFVRFMAASDADPDVERLYNFIQNGCSAFDNRYINENALKSKFQQVVPLPIAAGSSHNAAAAFNVVLWMPNVAFGRIGPVAARNNGPFLFEPEQQAAPFDEPELVEY